MATLRAESPKWYAFVIGGGGGIRREASIAFVKEGARGRASATNPDFRAEAIQVDVTLPDSVQRATAYMIKTFGRIDYCVNGTGIRVSRRTIVNLASVLSFRSLPHAASYTPSKHAVVGLTRLAALDNIKHNIRVNYVCPSWVDTPMVERISKATEVTAPEEIADAIIFLSSHRSS
ncbi:NAD(P)-binding protein [Xylaria digitata]|nr:NAD(P)-binding protein [Xylaria digitata]